MKCILLWFALEVFCLGFARATCHDWSQGCAQVMAIRPFTGVDWTEWQAEVQTGFLVKSKIPWAIATSYHGSTMGQDYLGNDVSTSLRTRLGRQWKISMGAHLQSENFAESQQKSLNALFGAQYQPYSHWIVTAHHEATATTCLRSRIGVHWKSADHYDMAFSASTGEALTMEWSHRWSPSAQWGISQSIRWPEAVATSGVMVRFQSYSAETTKAFHRSGLPPRTTFALQWKENQP